MYDLEGKVAVVTGAGGEHGIGRAIAARLAAEGANVVVTDIARQPHPTGPSAWRGLPDVVREIEALGRTGVSVEADVADSTQVEEIARQAEEHLGRIDIWVNNAAALAGKDRVPVVDLLETEWDHVQAINARGTFLGSKAAAQRMIHQGQGGRIINISSTAGKQGMPKYAAYCASKFAVIGFTQSLAHELAEHRITVNALCPGLVKTERVQDMVEALRPSEVPREIFQQKMLQDAVDITPLGRVAQPQDIADVAAFLASSQANYITGLSINVAGGSLMD